VIDLRTTTAGLALSTALIAGSLLSAPTAEATEVPPTASRTVDTSRPYLKITPELVDRAIAEAREAGAVLGEQAHSDGTRTLVVDAGDGASITLGHIDDPRQRLSGGSDNYGGVYVGFNAFDQNLIISGAAAGLTAGICLLGPAVCAVATVAITLATVAVSTNGGVQCGTKSLRVYPISHKKPRCA
jgi:hypothetical protein